MVAIKSMKRNVRVADGALEGFNREIEILRGLQHPNIVKIIGQVAEAESISLVMEFVDGGALGSIIQKCGRFPESLVALYMQQVLAGLQFLHEHKIIHRDIKGGNILVDKDGVCKLVDFGCAAEVCSDMSKRVTVVGSPYWMAPEVVSMTGTTDKSDIWSFGATVVELIAGQPPFWGMPPVSAMFHIVSDPLPPIPPDASEDLRSMLTLCFQKNPLDRPSAEQLRKHPFFASKRHRSRPSMSYDELLGDLQSFNTPASDDSTSPGDTPATTTAQAVSPSSGAGDDATGKMTSEELSQRVQTLRRKLHKQRTRRKKLETVVTELRSQLAKQRAELEERNSPDKSLRDFFNLLVMATKTAAFADHRVCEVNTTALYNEAIREHISWYHWAQWVPKRIFDQQPQAAPPTSASPSQGRRK